MSSTKKPSIPSLSKPPKNLATEVFPLVEIARVLADNAGLEAGKYALVVEFKLGDTLLRDPGPNSSSVPGLAVGIAGIGLAKTDTDGPLTLDYKGKGKKRSTSKA